VEEKHGFGPVNADKYAAANRHFGT
jgi:hypothetical protein